MKRRGRSVSVLLYKAVLQREVALTDSATRLVANKDSSFLLDITKSRT